MANDCKKVRLYHAVWDFGPTPTGWGPKGGEAVVDKIRKQGLVAPENGCGPSEPYPPRRQAIFALDDVEIKFSAQGASEMLTWSQEAKRTMEEMRGKPIAQIQKDMLNEAVIEFEVCEDDVMVGDISAECRERYLDSMMPYKDFHEKTNPPGALPPTLGNPRERGRWGEVEFFVPGPGIPLNQIKSIRRLRDYL
jgi:hypothetical protein